MRARFADFSWWAVAVALGCLGTCRPKADPFVPPTYPYPGNFGPPGGPAPVVPVPARQPIPIAMFVGGGTAGYAGIERLLAPSGNYAVRRIVGDDVRAGALSQFTVVIFPGGSGRGQAKALGREGIVAVRSFVHAGGGYLGVCGGSYLATGRPGWKRDGNRLSIINAMPRFRTAWFRGKGVVQIEFTEQGRTMLGTAQSRLNVPYQNGPILMPAGNTELPPYVTVAHYRTEIWNTPAQKGTMVNTPAIIGAPFGKGRVIISSPHPEGSPETRWVFERAVAWVAGNEK